MKTKLTFILAIVTITLFASCTPQSITDDQTQTEQQIDKKKLEIPTNG